MRKVIIFLLCLLCIYIFTEQNQTIIPDEAIRLRVIANSNSKYDQDIKKKVSNEMQNNLSYLLKDTKEIVKARDIITSNISYLSNNVENVLAENNYELGYSIDYGEHYFPSKEYAGKTYKEGNYESLLVKLGKGEGDNWWCVLFPPLCLIEAEESEKVEYNFYLKDLFDKWF